MDPDRYRRDLLLLATEPRAATAVWMCLSPADRAALQATHPWQNNDPDRYSRDLFLLATEPRAAAAVWMCLSPAERTALQATHWWIHNDLRWYLFGFEAVCISDSASPHSRPRPPGELAEAF